MSGERSTRATTPDRPLRLVDGGDDVAAIHGALRHVGTVPELFAIAAGLAPQACGFTRAVVASVRDHQLSASDSIAFEDSAGDALRRMLLASPVDLEPGTEETACVRRAGRRQLRQLPSLLAETLGLEQYALGAVAPESVTLALLVVDRTGPPVSAEERSAVDAFATLLGICLENLVLRQRIADLSQEIREFAGVAQALAREALEAPATIEDRYQHHGPARSASPAGERPRGVDAISRLTAGERRIALLLAHGRTNREIATELVVSAETVKSHVANILRKLGAANRVEAASLLLRDD